MMKINRKTFRYVDTLDSFNSPSQRKFNKTTTRNVETDNGKWGK